MAEWQLNGPDAAVLTKREVVEYLKLGSLKALDGLIKVGQFPRGRQRGRQVTWTGADVAAYLQLEGRYRTGPLPEDEKGGEDDDG